MEEYVTHDQAVWEGIFGRMPAGWYEAPPSDAMVRARAYFEAYPCKRVLDVGCGFGRWAQFLAGHGVEEVVGIDYAERGIRAARAWAERAAFNARFVVASAMALPFHGQPFDGVLAALIFDNLSRADCVEAVRSLNSLVRAGGPGFFVFSPALTAAELAAIPDGNPTKGCMHVAYEDDELPGCLPDWSVTTVGVSAEGFRLVEATRLARG
jgi:ubiquinone/menaquinone biosynthesis C-methylase UbiE